MSAPPAPLVVIGVGHALLADDAVGVRVVGALRGLAHSPSGGLPPATTLVDGGTQGINLAGWVRGSRGLVIADAVRLGGAPGTVSVLRAGDPPGVLRGTDAAGAVADLLAVCRLMDWLPGEVTLVGVEAGDVEPGVRLSPAVEAAIPVAVDAVVDELHRIDGRTRNPSRGAAAAMAGALA